MFTHQLSSKNLTVNERMTMVDDFKEEVRIENERKREESDKQFYGNQYNKIGFLQMEKGVLNQKFIQIKNWQKWQVLVLEPLQDSTK
ncbi:hypothetical protein D7V86_24930 [bacterium D16-51]|nr:hypothetical protein D7V96_24045 [bacterium D16-59]RKI53523.1 hypothetical protein D7V86_24930 [bacterium D16-51]